MSIVVIQGLAASCTSTQSSSEATVRIAFKAERTESARSLPPAAVIIFLWADTSRSGQ